MSKPSKIFTSSSLPSEPSSSPLDPLQLDSKRGNSVVSRLSHPPTPPHSPAIPSPPSHPLPTPPACKPLPNDPFTRGELTRPHGLSLPTARRQSLLDLSVLRLHRSSSNLSKRKSTPPPDFVSGFRNLSLVTQESKNTFTTSTSTETLECPQISTTDDHKENKTEVESVDSQLKTESSSSHDLSEPVNEHDRKEEGNVDSPGASSAAAGAPGLFSVNSAVVSIAGTETRVEMGSSGVPSLTKRSSQFLKKVGILPDEQVGDVANNADQTVFSVRQGKRLFTVYKVMIKSGQQQWAIYKRYSEFDQLDRAIQKQFPLIHKYLPDLPPKRYIWDNMNPDFIQTRAAGLHRYIQHIFTSPVLLRSQPVREFLLGSQSIGSITAPLSVVDKMSETSEDHSSSDSDSISLSSERQIETRRNGIKPKAVFNTTISPSGQTSAPRKMLPGKSAMKNHDAVKKTLKRVGWRRTIFEHKFQSPPGDSVLPPDETTTSTMLYSSSHDKEGRGSVSSMMSDSQSRVSINDFNLLKIIGKGNFGKVMLAQHKEQHKVYAIKVISKSAIRKKSAKAAKNGTSTRDVDHIMAERNVLVRSVNHPFLIGLRWAFQTSEKLYFVTDYVNGGELFFHLQRERKFSELRARFYAAEIVSALEYLHVEVDVVYRDLKPENILLDAEGHIKLTDFGLAKEHFHRQNRGRTSTFCGTPEYLAPEVLRNEPYGFPVDWWCLGSVLYEMLVGIPPFYSKDVPEMYDKILNEKLRFPPQITLRTRSVISGLLHRSPYFRLGTGPNNTSNPAVVKAHPFFEGLDWKKLYRREYTPPFVPTVSHLYDLRNIDPQFVNEPIPASVLQDGILNGTADGNDFEIEVSGISASNTGPQMFKGFTFIGEDEWLNSDD